MPSALDRACGMMDADGAPDPAARVIVGPDGSAFHLAPFVMRPGIRVGVIQRHRSPDIADGRGRSGVQRRALSPDRRPDDTAPPPELRQLRPDLRAGGFI